MSKYGWVITQDLINSGDNVGVIGPRNNPHTEEKIKESGVEFMMKDDDGVVYYYGKYLGPDDECLFGPLDDFGGPNDGCASIWYKDNGNWKVL